MTDLNDLFTVLFVLAASFVALGFLISIVLAILDSDAETAQERDLARLTAPLPDVETETTAVLELVEAPIAGRHRPDYAPGTDAQRRCQQTMQFSAVTA